MSYLTDKEKRLLFSALSREKKVCEEVDKECCREPYETPLKRVVESLESKFYYDRFEKDIRNKVVEEFVEEAMKQFTEFDLKHGYPTVADCNMILREIAEQMKEVGE